jgi:hypothetical protein
MRLRRGTGKNLPEEFSESHWRNLVNLGGRSGIYGVMLGGPLLPGGIQVIGEVGGLLRKEFAAGFLSQTNSSQDVQGE